MDLYTNKSLDFNSYSQKPEETTGFSLNQIKTIIDWFSVMVDTERTQFGIERFETIISKPFNCFFGSAENNVIIGFTNYMATRENNVINTIKSSSLESLSLEEAISKMKSSASNELGLENYSFAVFDKKILMSAKSYLDDVYQEAEQTNKRVIEVMNNHFKNNELIFLQLTSSMILSSKTYLEQLGKRKNKMNFNPIFKADNLVIDPKMVFCALPFNDERLEIFTEIIRPHLEKMQLSAFKVNDIKSITGNIMENIWTYGRL